MKVRLRVPLVAIALGAVFLYLFGKWSERQGRERIDIIARAETSLNLHHAFVEQQNRFRAASRKHVTAARTETVHLIAIASTLPAPELRIHLERLAGDWEGAFRAESLRADNAERRIADLETNLRATLTVAECRMLGIKFLPRCPSRTVSFVVGAGTAAFVLIATRH